ncbi:MAG: TolC family protein [Chitinivibrionales bacterium]|nr:TolC family protein [Chitinivibrionales bacterium]
MSSVQSVQPGLCDRLVLQIPALLVVVCLCSTVVMALSEKEALELALLHHPQLQIAKIDRSYDSLSHESVKSELFPTFSFAASEKYVPVDTTTVTLIKKPTPIKAGFDERSTRFQAKVNATQQLSSAAVIEASIEQNQNHAMAGDSSTYATTATAQITQPFLKNSGKHGALAYSLRIKSIDAKESRLQFKKKVLTTITEVRTLYWDAYEKEMLLMIVGEKKTFSQKRLLTARSKFTFKTASELDTLSAYLDFLESTRLMMQAENDRSNALRQLSRVLNASLSSLTIDTAASIAIDSLPPADLLLSAALNNDPHMALFSVMKERFFAQKEYSRNQRLPELSIQAAVSTSRSGGKLFSDDNVLHHNAVIGLIAGYELPQTKQKILKAQIDLQERKNDISESAYRRDICDKVNELTLRWNQEIASIDLSRQYRSVAFLQQRAARTGYEIGTVDQITLEKADTDYLEASIRFLQQRITMKKLEILIDEVTTLSLAKYGVVLQ